MNSVTDTTAPQNQAGSAVSAREQRPWHAPEIEEVDYAETKSNIAYSGSDGTYGS